MKKLTAILIVFTLAVSFSCNVCASNYDPLDVPQPYWNSLSSITNDLNVKDGEAEISIYVRAVTSIDYISVTSVLQKRSFLIFWSDEYTYNYSFSEYYGTYEKNVTVGSGTWRLKTTVKTYKGGVLQEEITVYSED